MLAALLGGLIGLERQLRRKPAGIRTNVLICFGATLFTIISYEMAGTVGGDHTRIAAQIIPVAKAHLGMAQQFLATGAVSPEVLPAPGS